MPASAVATALAPILCCRRRDEPLSGWDVSARNGWVRRVKDEHIRERCLELHGAHPDSCYITLPARLDEVVGVKRPQVFTIVLKLVRRLQDVWLRGRLAPQLGLAAFAPGNA